MSDRIHTVCPDCKSKLVVNIEHAGKVLRCPKCNAGVQVPASDQGPPGQPTPSELPEQPMSKEPAIGEPIFVAALRKEMNEIRHELDHTIPKMIEQGRTVGAVELIHGLSIQLASLHDEAHNLFEKVKFKAETLRTFRSPFSAFLPSSNNSEWNSDWEMSDFLILDEDVKPPIADKLRSLGIVPEKHPIVGWWLVSIEYFLIRLTHFVEHDYVPATWRVKEATATDQPSRHIPSEVRLEVWRRDEGKCVNCGSKEKLEYDHIIPHSKGGSNTGRNIQLLCEPCNRKKAASIS